MIDRDALTKAVRAKTGELVSSIALLVVDVIEPLIREQFACWHDRQNEKYLREHGQQSDRHQKERLMIGAMIHREAATAFRKGV